MSSHVEETFSNIRTVKAFATEKEESDKFLVNNTAVCNLGITKAWWFGTL